MHYSSCHLYNYSNSAGLIESIRCENSYTRIVPILNMKVTTLRKTFAQDKISVVFVLTLPLSHSRDNYGNP